MAKLLSVKVIQLDADLKQSSLRFFFKCTTKCRSFSTTMLSLSNSSSWAMTVTCQEVPGKLIEIAETFVQIESSRKFCFL